MDTIFKRSAAVERLIDALSHGSDLQTYDELSKVAQAKVNGKGRHLLASARRSIRRDLKMVFGVLRGVGLQRLDDSGKAVAVESAVRRVRSASRNGKRTAETVNPVALPADVRLGFVARATQLALADEVASSKSGRALMRLAGPQFERPQLKAAFEALRDTENGEK